MKQILPFVIIFFYFIREEYCQANITNKVFLECDNYVNHHGCTSASVVPPQGAQLTKIIMNCNQISYILYQRTIRNVDTYFSKHIAKIEPNKVEFCLVNPIFEGCTVTMSHTLNNVESNSVSDPIKVVREGVDSKCADSRNPNYKYQLAMITDDLDSAINRFDVDYIGDEISTTFVHICFPFHCEPLQKMSTNYTYTMDGNTIILTFQPQQELIIIRKKKSVFGGIKIVVVHENSAGPNFQYATIEIKYANLHLSKMQKKNYININSNSITVDKPSRCSVYFKPQNSTLEFQSINNQGGSDINVTHPIVQNQYLMYIVICGYFDMQNAKTPYSVTAEGFLYTKDTTIFPRPGNRTRMIMNMSSYQPDNSSMWSTEDYSNKTESGGGGSTDAPQSSKTTVIVVVVILIIVLIAVAVVIYILYRRKIQNA